MSNVGSWDRGIVEWQNRGLTLRRALEAHIELLPTLFVRNKDRGIERSCIKRETSYPFEQSLHYITSS